MMIHPFLSARDVAGGASSSARARPWIALPFILALLLAAVVGVSSARAQVADPVNIETIKKESGFLESTIRLLNNLTARQDLDDEALVGARVKLQNILNSANELIKVVDTRITQISDRLKEIGDAPENPADEPVEVANTRNALNTERASLAALKTEIEKIIATSQSAISDITVRRQEAFSRALFTQTQFTPALLAEVETSFVSELSSARSLLQNWLAFVWNNRLWEAIGSVLAAFVVAGGISVYFWRIFGRFVDRNELQPIYFNKVFTAFWATILPSAATAIFLATVFFLFSYFDVFSLSVQRIVQAFFVIIAGGVFMWNLALAVFAPGQPDWRLFEVTDRAARRLFTLIMAIYAVQALDFLFDTMNTQLAGGVALTAVQGLIASILIGGLLVFIALVKPYEKQVGGPAPRWPKWFSVPLIALGAGIIVVSALGYIGLGRFIAQQVVVTGAILATMWIGLVTANQLAKENVFASTTAGRFLHLRFGMTVERIEQLSLVFSLILFALVLLAGIPAILMQWGTRYEEILDFGTRLFTGIEIAGYRFSLSGILFGLMAFGIVLLLTRLLQGWLKRNVFPRSRADIGVQESIRAGIGYLGFGIAAMLALVTAGVNLSSLAIVAGALSLGIGFGLQNIVSNFVSGLILLVERPIKVGDWIVVGNAEGTVKRISVRATEVETFQQQSIIIPNSELINSQVRNWTHKSKSGRVDINIGVDYGTDVRLVEQILYDIARDHAMVAKKPAPSVWFTNFGESSLDFSLRMFLHDIGNSVIVQTEVRFEILKRFEEAGIGIPFPQRDLNVKLEGPVLEALSNVKISRMEPRRKTAAAKPARGSRKPAGD